jgi:hypothetical protein
MEAGKKLSLEVFPIHATKTLGITQRREMPSPNIIVVVWSCSMGRERGGNLYNSQRMYPTSNLIPSQQDARVLFTALTPWFGVS